MSYNRSKYVPKNIKIYIHTPRKKDVCGWVKWVPINTDTINNNNNLNVYEGTSFGFLITKFQCGGLEVFLCQKAVLRSDIPPPLRCQSQTQIVTCTSDQLVTKQRFLQGPLQVLLLKQVTEHRETFYLLDNCIIFMIKDTNEHPDGRTLIQTPAPPFP